MKFKILNYSFYLIIILRINIILLLFSNFNKIETTQVNIGIIFVTLLLEILFNENTI